MPAHALSPAFPRDSRVNDAGRLEVGGCDVADLAREFGTPAYLVAEDDLRARAGEVNQALADHHPDGEALFASKSFPCTAVYRVFAEEGLGCDVASGGELHLALRASFDPARIYLHGNAKSEQELQEALDARVRHIVLDSFDDLSRLERLAARAGREQGVMIRVTPGVAGDTHEAISTGQADSKFGFSVEAARRAIEQVRGSSHLELGGLHCHIGSQLFDLEPFAAAVRTVAELEPGLPAYNLGGGLGVAYTAS